MKRILFALTLLLSATAFSQTIVTSGNPKTGQTQLSPTFFNRGIKLPVRDTGDYAAWEKMNGMLTLQPGSLDGYKYSVVGGKWQAFGAGGGGGVGVPYNLTADTLLAKFSTAGNVRITQDGAKVRADLNVRLDTAGGFVTYNSYALLLNRVMALETGVPNQNLFTNLTFAGSTQETSTGSRIWVPVPGAPVGSTGVEAWSVETFAAGKEGIMAITEYEAGVTGDYSVSISGLAQATSTGNSPYAYNVEKTTGKVYLGGTSPAAGVQLATGDLVGFRRIAGALNMVRSVDGGVVWTTLFTTNAVDNTALHTLVNLTPGTGKFKNPKNKL